MVDAVPAGYTALTPYLVVRDGAEAVAFYAAAFGATEVMRLDGPDGRILHGEIDIGGARLMLTSANPAWQMAGPDHYGGTPVMMMHYCDDCDATYARAIGAGAESLEAPADMFWGDRMARVQDPFGHRWSIATHVRDLTPAEMAAAQADAIRDMTEG